MIFTDRTILDSMDKGLIKIEPFVRENLGTNSIDLTLNENLLVYKKSEEWFYDVKYDGHIKKERDRFGTRTSFLKDNNYALDPKEKQEVREYKIKETGFILVPGMLYIASTNEYTETWNAVPKIEGKSSLGRLGLFIHVTAGYGDVGFQGKWTLELVATVPIKVYPNMKICQISYHGISEPPLVKYNEKPDQKYNGQDKPTESLYHENFKK